MSQSKLTVDVPILTQYEDYPGWAKQATHALKVQKVWLYVSGQIVELRNDLVPTVKDKWADKQNDDLAKGFILSRLSDSIQRRIEEELGDVEYNSEKLWETIEKVCSSKKNYRKFAFSSCD
jgi:hypothetical protein